MASELVKSPFGATHRGEKSNRQCAKGLGLTRVALDKGLIYMYIYKRIYIYVYIYIYI